MSDSYYDDNPYTARPAGQGPYYPPPPPQQNFQQPPSGHNGSHGYYPPDPQQRGTHTPPQEAYPRGTPPPPNMQVGPYREYDDRSDYSHAYPESSHHHHHHHDHSSSTAGSGSYDESPRRHSHDSVGHHREPEKSHNTHNKEKDIGATLLGAAVGGFAGHEVGHNGVATVLGVVAGAYGGHKLENKHEKKKEEERRREKEGKGPRYEPGPYAGLERGVGESGRRHSKGGRSYDGESSESESEYEDRSRRHHQ